MKKILTSLIFIFFATYIIAQPKLSSFPAAKATIFLDFDGQFVTATPWNGGASFYCAPSGLSDQQITEVFHRVSEDFRPFEINITTDSTVYLAAPLTNRVRVIVTPTSGWYTGVGGVSFTRSFTWGDGTPAFVFPDRLAWSPKIIAECCSHEVGHTLGLSHQAKYNENCSLITTYNDGAGSGEIAWAPVMGNSYYRNFSGWNNGPTPSGCNADQDNLSIITGINGFSYRADDHKDHPRDGATRLELNDNNFNANGIITTSDDKDAFEFNFTSQGKLKLYAKPFSVGPNNAGANLDVKVILMNAAYETITVFDPQDKLDVSVDTTLNAGKYFVLVQGAGNMYSSNYGSLGSYTISGDFSSLSIMPVYQLSLKGNADADKHKLIWELICDESIADQDIQISYNGKEFKDLAIVSPATRQFIYNPLQQGDLYYRIKVTTLTGNISYSNIIALKQLTGQAKISVRSTMVTDKIEINADQNYQYILADLNGKILKKGNGTTGLNVINLSNSPDGIYIIQMISNSQKITQRIVKL